MTRWRGRLESKRDPRPSFPFFTDPDKMTLWKGVEADLDPKPGGVYRVNVTGHNIARGEYVEIVPNTRVVFTWGWESDDSPLAPGSSTVEICLIPDGGATVVRLRHTGLAADQQDGHAEGWEHYLPRPSPWRRRARTRGPTRGHPVRVIRTDRRNR